MRAVRIVPSVRTEPHPKPSVTKSDFVPVGERLIHCDLIDVFEVAPDRHSHRYSSYAQSQRLQQTTDEIGCRFAFGRSEEHTSELQSQSNLVCRLLLEKKKKKQKKKIYDETKITKSN